MLQSSRIFAVVQQNLLDYVTSVRLAHTNAFSLAYAGLASSLFELGSRTNAQRRSGDELAGRQQVASFGLLLAGQ